MPEQTLTADCQFCSVVSQANGEDPIGSAGTYDYWIITELAPPWSDEIWQQHPTIRTILSMLKDAILNRGMKLRPLAIAPDRDYSHPGYTRILFYSRPAQQFARYSKTEYLIPEDQIIGLIQALLTQSDDLVQFAPYQQNSQHMRDLLVCTHGNVDVACSRFGYPIYQTLRNEYAEDRLRIWRCSHFGGHRFAPTLIDLPHGQYWGHLNPDILDTLVYRRGCVADLRPFYRGWSGLSPFAQIVERDLWIKHGWDWLEHLKSGDVMALDQRADNREPTWAEVRIEFSSPNTSRSGAYEARVEAVGEVITQHKSGITDSLMAVPQYRVSRLDNLTLD